MLTIADEILAHWNTRLFHWNTCANPSVPDQMSRSGLKVTTHRVSARSEEVDHLGTLAHQKVTNLDSPPTTPAPRCQSGRVASVGLRLSFFFSVKNEDVGVPVCQPGDDLRH
eukprot:COSAG06_NODE_3745_length_4949_cov_10.597938_2_plen_112_part_00